MVSSLSSYKIINERGTKTVFTYAHLKWFYGQSERGYYSNYFLKMYIYRSPEFDQFLITTTLSGNLHFVYSHFVFTF